MENPDEIKADEASLEAPQTAKTEAPAPAQAPASVSALEEGGVVSESIMATPDGKVPELTVEKKQFFLLRLIKRINIYFILLFVVLLIFAAISIYAVRKNTASNQEAAFNTQALTQEDLSKLANSDAVVGDAKQTLTVGSNAIFSGSVLVRGGLDVAGTIKVGGPLSLPGLTVGGTTSLDLAALKELTVSGIASIQGKVNAQGGLNVTGGATFSGTVAIGQLTVDTLDLTKDLKLTRHITASGGTVGSSNGAALGGGGTASVSGTDTAGTVTINTGGSAPTGCFVTVNFAAAYGSVPRVVISPASPAAAALNYYTTRTASGFSICTASDPADGTAGMTFDYIVIG
jgi:cytoskeletal protein CcmA (bactofilin family)